MHFPFYKKTQFLQSRYSTNVDIEHISALSSLPPRAGAGYHSIQANT